MSIDNIDFRILMHTSAIVRPVPAYIAHTPYIRCKHWVFLYVCMMNYGQTSGFPETLGFIRPIGTGALWSRSGRKPFGAFRQPKPKLPVHWMKSFPLLFFPIRCWIFASRQQCGGRTAKHNVLAVVQSGILGQGDWPGIRSTGMSPAGQQCFQRRM